MAARGAQLIGSVGKSDAEAVFRAVAGALPGKLKRMPDGETSDRSTWVGYQLGKLAETEGIGWGAPRQNPAYEALPQLKLLKPASEIRLGNLGYADTAAASFALFDRLQQEGVIGREVRFQVSLPTPLAVVNSWIELGDEDAFEPVYEQALFAEVRRLLAAVPNERLAIQWDGAVEVALLEGAFLGTERQRDFDGLVDRVSRCVAQVPEPVEVGFHCCYGDYHHQHFKQPADLGLCVKLIHALDRKISRRMTWYHMPVPAHRTDEAFFHPLRSLRVSPQTELYFGVVHAGGEALARKLIARVEEALGPGRPFGVATECGMGRGPPEHVDPLLAIHAAVTAPL